MAKVSFDFDGVLDSEYIQEYAKELISRNVEVWICTARPGPEDAPNEEYNDDLFQVVEDINISEENIIFTNKEDKSTFLNDNGFRWHLDDCWITCKDINRNTDLLGITNFGSASWKSKCEKYL